MDILDTKNSLKENVDNSYILMNRVFHDFRHFNW